MSVSWNFFFVLQSTLQRRKLREVPRQDQQSPTMESMESYSGG